jgi:hypothetical protein
MVSDQQLEEIAKPRTKCGATVGFGHHISGETVNVRN